MYISILIIYGHFKNDFKKNDNNTIVLGENFCVQYLASKSKNSDFKSFQCNDMTALQLKDPQTTQIIPHRSVKYQVYKNACL